MGTGEVVVVVVVAVVVGLLVFFNGRFSCLVSKEGVRFSIFSYGFHNISRKKASDHLIEKSFIIGPRSPTDHQFLSPREEQIGPKVPKLLISREW